MTKQARVVTKNRGFTTPIFLSFTTNLDQTKQPFRTRQQNEQ